MTRKIGNNIILEEQDPAICELCGKEDELRPYGPKGENICYECGMKNIKTTKKKFAEFLNGKIQ